MKGTEGAFSVFRVRCSVFGKNGCEHRDPRNTRNDATGCRSGDLAAKDVCPGALRGSRPGGRSYRRGKTLDPAFQCRSGDLCGSGNLAAKDVASTPWDIRGRVAAPTGGV